MYQYLVWQLLQPIPVAMLLMAIGILWLWRKRRETKRRLLGVTMGFILLYFISCPSVGYVLRGSLEWQYPPLVNRSDGIEAIVVLSSSIYPSDSVRPRVEPDPDTLYRCLEAVGMYKQGPPCPVVVSGGVVLPRPGVPSNASMMRDLLVTFGVRQEQILLEDESTTTYENALGCSGLLQPRGIHRILLVTDATHLPRAVGCFKKQGFEVIACGCQYRATPTSAARYGWLPNPASAMDFSRSLHEWLGIAWYAWKGRTA